MPKTKEIKKYVVVSRAIAILIVIGAILIAVVNMNKSEQTPAGPPEAFIHEHQLSFFEKDVFEKRRERILAMLDADIVILSAATRPDFRYVTGFDEHRGIAVIKPGSEEAYSLFVTPWEIYTVMWTGEVHGLEGAINTFGADAAFALDDFEEKLPGMLRGQQRIYLHGEDERMHTLVQKVLDDNNQTAEIVDIAPVLHELRIFKDDWEIAQFKKAVAVTKNAHRYVWETIKPGLSERQVQANIEYIYGHNGLEPGIPSIVGSGPNTCLLHHRPGDRIIEENDLVLIDIGARSSGGYIVDVTRTIPVSGRFTPKQKEIYELVLKAFDTSIVLMKPGYNMLDCHHNAMRVMVNGLHEMGLLPDTSSWWQKRFYMQHRVNHYIGLRSHDVGDYGYDNSVRDKYILDTSLTGRKLEPGMVMTLEPGLYFMEGLLDGIHDLFGHLATSEELNAFVDEVRPIYEKYEGIGVRIEDDILITDDGFVNLSGDLPRSVEEIERMLSR